MKYINIAVLFILLLLTACSQTYVLESYNNDSISVNTTEDSIIQNIISPYKKGIKNEMEEVICFNKNYLQKNKPESTIGNFVTDLCMQYVDVDICILNNGGLRTEILRGNVTRGKIFELMPFDNELVIIELEKKEFIQLIDYIIKRNGEPFSGMKITINNKGQLINCDKLEKFDNKIRVLTSDYLANGGDKMWFFTKKKQFRTGIKIRDAIIDYCLKTDTIDVKLDSRITILENE